MAQGLRGNYKFIFAEYLNFVSDYSRFEITPTGANRQEAACKCVGKHFIHSISKEVLSQEVKEEKKKIQRTSLPWEPEYQTRCATQCSNVRIFARDNPPAAGGDRDHKLRGR